MVAKRKQRALLGTPEGPQPNVISFRDILRRAQGMDPREISIRKAIDILKQRREDDWRATTDAIEALEAQVSLLPKISGLAKEVRSFDAKKSLVPPEYSISLQDKRKYLATSLRRLMDEIARYPDHKGYRREFEKMWKEHAMDVLDYRTRINIWKRYSSLPKYGGFSAVQYAKERQAEDERIGKYKRKRSHNHK